MAVLWQNCKWYHFDYVLRSSPAGPTTGVQGPIKDTSIGMLFWKPFFYTEILIFSNQNRPLNECICLAMISQLYLN